MGEGEREAEGGREGGRGREKKGWREKEKKGWREREEGEEGRREG